ncbi:MAG: hypothetical protein WB919_09705, partial [Candidatus Sulfotelmatobacter sp.]
MKRTAIMIFAVLEITAWSFGQNKPATSSSSSTTQTATGQAVVPAGKRPPQAKTQPEFDAYKAVAAITDAAAQEKA